VSGVSTAEGNSGTHLLVFTVRLSDAHTAPISIAYATADGTPRAASASRRQRLRRRLGPLTFPAGSVYRRVAVPVRGDLMRRRSASS